MKVLDATFLIDYGNEVDAAAEYLLAHSEEQFIVPAPVFTEYLLGSVHSSEPTDLEGARSELAWSEVIEIAEETAVTAAAVADEISRRASW
jgi:predicted nucleic acid-binding protein